MLKARSYRRQSTAYVDKPDIPIPCSSFGQGYLRTIQNSLTSEHSTYRHGTKHLSQKSLESSVSGKLDSSLSLTTDLKLQSKDGFLKPNFKQTSISQNLSSNSTSPMQSISLQLALYSSFSTLPRSDKKASALSMPSAMKKSQKQQQSRREKVDTSQDALMRLSFPCRAGCCYCVYRSLLGPVRVSFSQGTTPKRGRFLAAIRDGNGRSVIPSSRKADIRGLVYDPLNHSLHPPAVGERPMFRKYSLLRDENTKESTKPETVTQGKINDHFKRPQDLSVQRKRKFTLPHCAYKKYQMRVVLK